MASSSLRLSGNLRRSCLGKRVAPRDSLPFPPTIRSNLNSRRVVVRARKEHGNQSTVRGGAIGHRRIPAPGGAFREWVSNDGSTPYPAVAGRYHLYVSLACPWASRTLIVRQLAGVGKRDRHDRGRSSPRRDAVGPFAMARATAAIRSMASRSSAKPTAPPIRLDGRVTVPVLWDKETAGSSTTPRTTSAGCSTAPSRVRRCRRRTFP